MCHCQCSFNRVLLSKALLCDGLPEEILMFTTKNLTLCEVWTSNFWGNLSHIWPETEGLYCFCCTMLDFKGNCQKWALCADRCLLRRDAIMSHDRFWPMGARQNLLLYYNNPKMSQETESLWSLQMIFSLALWHLKHFQFLNCFCYLSGFLGSLFSFLQFLCCPLIGAVSDVLGRRTPMILCMVKDLFLNFLLIILVFIN